MTQKFTRLFTCLFIMSLTPSSLFATTADLQFFGDTYVPAYVLKALDKETQTPKNLIELAPLLESSRTNIVNFEGVASTSFFPYDMKRFFLKMPIRIGEYLANNHIHVAGLANNHLMDYGYMGMFDTLYSLKSAGILTYGAGENLDDASKPVFLDVSGRRVCLLAYSRTLPTSFWAGKNKPGTSSKSFTATGEQVAACKKKSDFVAVSIHWGAESSRHVKKYQVKLAKLAIDKGADIVVGHHPHILQKLDFYKEKPIFYSIGNFSFGTAPSGSYPEGVALRIIFGSDGVGDKIEVTPIQVNNLLINFRLRPFQVPELSPLGELVGKNKNCELMSDGFSYRCGRG